MSKNVFFIYIKKKSIVTLNLKCITLWKHIYWPNQQIFVKIIFEIIKKMFFKSVKEKKEICHKKSFSVFGGVQGKPLNTIKSFFGKVFLHFFSLAYEKYIFHHFKIFCTKICWYYLAMMFFFTIIHLKLSVTNAFSWCKSRMTIFIRMRNSKGHKT